MKIKTKLNISIFIAVGLILLFGLFLFMAGKRIVVLEQREQVAEGIAHGVFELNILAGDYLLHGEERSEVQWLKKHATMGEVLNQSRGKFTSFEYRGVFREIQVEHNELLEVYQELVQEDAPAELTERLASRLSILSQTIVLRAIDLAKLSQEESERITERIFVFFSFFILVLAVALFLNSYVLSRSFTKSITQLVNTTERVERGDFDARADLKTEDEFELLGGSLNKMAQALGRMDQERKQLDKAKTRFLSITSHELRSPMTPMKAQLQMLEAGYFGKVTQKQRGAIQTVIRNADRLDKIIADFLEVSRIEAARLKFVFKKANLVDVTRNLVEEMKGFMPEKHIVLTTTLARLPIIECDPDRVSQVLRNLINNAIKFTPKGGKVIIGAKARSEDILFSVKDSGIGLGSADQTHIFEPFFQAEQTLYRKKGGTGLGLAICRGIVQSQKGRMWVKSRLGEGSTFYFTVPKVPVREIKPIKILFSTKEGIEKDIKGLFVRHLGPLGVREFEEVQQQDLTLESVLSHISHLYHQKILDSSDFATIRSKVYLAFNMKEEKSKEELMHGAMQILISYLGPLARQEFRLVTSRNVEYRRIVTHLRELRRIGVVNKKEFDSMIHDLSMLFKMSNLGVTRNRTKNTRSVQKKSRGVEGKS